MMGVLFALLAAACNAFANVLQRRAAALIPDEEELRLGLIRCLLRRPVWYAGMVALLGGFVFQATALNHDSLAVVQPLLIVELPVTLLIASAVFRRPLDRSDWLAVAAISIGLALALFAADPSEGTDNAALPVWLLAAFAVVGLMAVAVLVSLRVSGGIRAGLFGVASGAGFGLTAALMKSAIGLLDQGVHALATSPQVYAMVATGAVSLFLAENAFQAGPLAASQPAITISDPLSSIGLGIVLFGEEIRTGLALLPEAIGVVLVAGGVIVLARSPLVVGARPPMRAARDRAGARTCPEAADGVREDLQRRSRTR